MRTVDTMLIKNCLRHQFVKGKLHTPSEKPANAVNDFYDLRGKVKN